MSSKNKKGKLTAPSCPQQTPQDYDLQHALSVIRKGGRGLVETAEGTKTDLRIGSVIVNITGNPESNSETQTQIASSYATEQYVESLVNNLKADQKLGNTQLTESFNNKITAINDKIDKITEDGLSKQSYWTGIALVLTIIGLFIAFLLHDLQGAQKRTDEISTAVGKQEKRIDDIGKSLSSLNDTVLEIKAEVQEIKSKKKKK